MAADAALKNCKALTLPHLAHAAHCQDISLSCSLKLQSSPGACGPLPREGYEDPFSSCPLSSTEGSCPPCPLLVTTTRLSCTNKTLHLKPAGLQRPWSLVSLRIWDLGMDPLLVIATKTVPNSHRAAS